MLGALEVSLAVQLLCTASDGLKDSTEQIKRKNSMGTLLASQTLQVIEFCTIVFLFPDHITCFYSST